MDQTIREYIKQDATFFFLGNVTYYYVFVDLEEDGEEVLLASYNTVSGELEFETEDMCRNYLDNYSPKYVERHLYTYSGNGPKYVDVLIYDVPEEDIPYAQEEAH